MPRKRRRKGRDKTPPTPQALAAQDLQMRRYWRSNMRLTAILLTLWFAVSFGGGILLREQLDQFSVGGAPLGFWIAQQGSIYVFVILVFVYAGLMRRLERRLGISSKPRKGH